MSEYIPCLSFWVWVTSLRMFFSSSIHLPANFKMSFFYGWVILHCIIVPHFLYPFFCWGHLGCFQELAIMNNAAMNIAEQMFLWYECATFGYMPKSCIAGSWGRLTLNFLSNHTYFQSSCTSLHFHQHLWRSVPSTPIISSISCYHCSWS